MAVRTDGVLVCVDGPQTVSACLPAWTPNRESIVFYQRGSQTVSSCLHSGPSCHAMPDVTRIMT
eukprot:8179839-Pyramimonas_sp.AAC.1